MNNLSDINPRYLHNESETEPDFTTNLLLQKNGRKPSTNATDFIEDIQSLQ